MPFLLNFISKIKHESALNTLTRVQRANEKVPVPFKEMEDDIKNTEEGRLKIGDWIDLTGPSGSGKSTVMMEMAKYSLTTSPHHILFIDFDDRVNPIRDDRFHLCQLNHARNFSATLECWLEEHVNTHVLWVMVDNSSFVDQKCWQEIKHLQNKWGFILLTSTPIMSAAQLKKDSVNYRFEMSVTKETNEIQMQMVYHIMLEDEEYHISLIRYKQDFYELDHLLNIHFPEFRIPLPKLNKKLSTLRSLFDYKKKTNTELLQDYLYRSISTPIGKSSLFKDFLSIQRHEDRLMLKKGHQPSIAVQPTLKRKGSFYDVRQTKRLALNDYDIQQFESIKVLGKGATGKVILVRKEKRLFALKAIHKSWSITAKEVNHIKMERDILAKLSELHHPFLIQLYWAFQDIQNLYLVLDYHAGADLATLLQRFIYFPQEQCRLYCAEIVMGLQELHRHSILYR
ncbi:hypothetical protein G6F49_000035 [Rhizopus delemar]|nr:hypothetical protein G6F49_000035 [Rhizopus delemar]KAG1594690.1 hypothetical protein G6F48_001182 [Rhizopus delemar]